MITHAGRHVIENIKGLEEDLENGQPTHFATLSACASTTGS